MVILIKGGGLMNSAMKKALLKVVEELYRALVEILIGVLLIVISRHI